MSRVSEETKQKVREAVNAIPEENLTMCGLCNQKLTHYTKLIEAEAGVGTKTVTDMLTERYNNLVPAGDQVGATSFRKKVQRAEGKDFKCPNRTSKPEVKRTQRPNKNPGEESRNSKCRESTLKPETDSETTPETTPVPSQMMETKSLPTGMNESLTYKELEYKLYQATMTRDSYKKQLSDMRSELLEIRPALEKAKSELEEQVRHNVILGMALHDAGIPYSLV